MEEKVEALQQQELSNSDLFPSYSEPIQVEVVEEKKEEPVKLKKIRPAVHIVHCVVCKNLTGWPFTKAELDDPERRIRRTVKRYKVRQTGQKVYICTHCEKRRRVDPGVYERYPRKRKHSVA